MGPNQAQVSPDGLDHGSNTLSLFFVPILLFENPIS